MVDVLFAEAPHFFGAQGSFDIITHLQVGEGLYVRNFFIFDQEDVSAGGSFDGAAVLTGFEAEGDLREVRVQDGAFDPIPITTILRLGTLGIDFGEFGEIYSR